MNGFIDDDTTLGWLDDDDGSKLDAFEAEAQADGFVPIPDDHAPPQDGYEYRIHGPLCYYRKARLK